MAATMTEVMKHVKKQTSPQPAFIWPTVPLPLVMLILGVLLIAASFLPLGKWAAKSQWTTEDSAAFDRVSVEYKRSAYQSPARAGLTESEWKAQRERMQRQLKALQQKLERAKSQPKRWSRYLLGIGSLLTAAGFYANATRQS